MRFELNAKYDAEIVEKIKAGSQYCSNYMMLSSNLTNIRGFISTFSKSLRRGDSNYALIFPEDNSFSENTFLEDVYFLKKVLNLMVITLPLNHSTTSEFSELGARLDRRYQIRMN